MNVFKAMIALVWLWGVASFFTPPGAFTVMGQFLFWVFVLVHAVECVIFLPRLRAAGGSLPAQLARTFVFGIAHVRELPERPSPPA